VATEAAWLNGKNGRNRGKEQKTLLTGIGLLMEGLQTPVRLHFWLPPPAVFPSIAHPERPHPFLLCLVHPRRLIASSNSWFAASRAMVFLRTSGVP
jgi:hypothetical protein